MIIIIKRLRAFGNRYHGVPLTAKFTNQSKWEGDIVSVLSKRWDATFWLSGFFWKRFDSLHIEDSRFRSCQECDWIECNVGIFTGIRRNCSFHMIDLIFGYVVLRVDVPLLIAYACFHRGFVGLLDVFHDQVGPLDIVLCSDQDGKGTSWLVAGPHVNRPCLFFIYLGFGCWFWFLLLRDLRWICLWSDFIITLVKTLFLCLALDGGRQINKYFGAL